MAPRSGVTQHVGATGAHSTANITRALHGIHFPANKQQMITQANHNHALKEALEDIEHLADHDYCSMDEVIKNYGKHQ